MAAAVAFVVACSRMVGYAHHAFEDVVAVVSRREETTATAEALLLTDFAAVSLVNETVPQERLAGKLPEVAADGAAAVDAERHECFPVDGDPS